MKNTNGRITHIVFDIGNVILHFDYLRACRRFELATGLSKETIDKHFYFSDLERRYSKGQLSSEDFFATLVRELSLTIDYPTFSQIWNDIFWLNHAMADLIAELKGKYFLATITNTTDLHFRYWLENFKVFENIDRFFPSHEAGMRKPDPEFFKHVIKELGGNASQMVFIDDMAENAEAARQTGFNAVHYVTIEDLRKNLRALGVDVKEEEPAK